MTYTPSTDEVRIKYGLKPEDSRRKFAAQEAFDRWFAAEEARIRADERRRIAAAINAHADAQEGTSPAIRTYVFAHRNAASIAEEG